MVFRSRNRHQGKSSLFAPIIVEAVLIVICFMGGFSDNLAAEPLKVVTSIRPIHSLLSGITEGVFIPTLLVKHQSSPHHYTLRPSEKRLLKEADLVFWIGPELETFLPTILASVPAGHENIRLDQSPGLLKLDMRTGKEWEEDEGAEEDEIHHRYHHHPHHHGSAFDPHIWLSPQNAIKMADHMSAMLMMHDPANRVVYAHNLEKVKERLRLLDSELQKQLKNVKKVPFLVFHDGYQYFEQAYHLNGVGVIAINPELPLSSRRLELIQNKIQHYKVHCLFSEPQWGTHLVDILAKKYDIKVGMIDPLGDETPKPQDAYFENLRAMAVTMKRCLSK